MKVSESWAHSEKHKKYCVTDHLVCSIFVTQDLKPFCNKKKGSLTHLVALGASHYMTLDTITNTIHNHQTPYNVHGQLIPQEENVGLLRKDCLHNAKYRKTHNVTQRTV